MDQPDEQNNFIVLSVFQAYVCVVREFQAKQEPRMIHSSWNQIHYQKDSTYWFTAT